MEVINAISITYGNVTLKVSHGSKFWIDGWLVMRDAQGKFLDVVNPKTLKTRIPNEWAYIPLMHAQ